MTSIGLFKSHYSVGKSILTLEKPAPLDASGPVSIFSIAKEYKLPEITIVDDSLSGFLQAYTYAKDLAVKLVFGFRVTVTEDIKEKNEQSLKKNSKIIIFPKNLKGYKALIKLSTIASTEGFYYEPRLDFNTINDNYSDDLLVAIPFYDSFLFKNALYGHLCVPDFSKFSPLFLVEDNDLPFDDIIKNKITNYTKDKFSTNKAQSIFYHKKEDFLAYLTFKCINNRTTLNKPNLEHMSSDTFCVEHWLNNK